MKRIQLKSFKVGLVSFLSITLLLFVQMVFAQADGKPKWTHYSIDPQLVGSAWGTGGIGLADFDGDGDLDMALSRRESSTGYWYERTNDSTWVRHVMGVSGDIGEALGSTALDMNQDGWVDVTFEGVWFENPGTLAQNPNDLWPQHTNVRGHDAVCADVNGDGHDDLVTYDGHQLLWFNTSDNLTQTTVGSNFNDHGGIDPHGFGDIDNDGDLDLVIPGFWFANPGDGTGTWAKRLWPFTEVSNSYYGRSCRSWIADINKDGRNDIVYSNCDVGSSHVYWVENNDNGTNWTSHKLDDPPTASGDVEGTGSFHSLGVADFDQDGNLDIFAGEQEDPDQMWGSWKPMKISGLKERGVIWYSSGGPSPDFAIDVIQLDNPGWHDAEIGDVDGDGDIDIVSKIWNKDRVPSGLKYHADFWRNDLDATSTSGKLERKSEIKFFPVPVKNEIQLTNLPLQSHIEVYNAVGSKVAEDVNGKESSIKLNVCDLKPGLYLMKVISKSTSITKSFKWIKS